MTRSYALLLVLTQCVCFAQEHSGPGDDLVLRSGTREVLLDFVVRDKHQNMVKDLRPEEVQILEDSVVQKPKSFRYRDGAAPGASGNSSVMNAGASVSSAAYDPLREINLVSVVFESMGPENRRRASQFAHELLETEVRPNTWIAVFALHHQLSALQPYTTDLNLVNRAIEKAGTGAYQQFAKENLDLVKSINQAQAVAALSNRARFQPLEPGTAEEKGPGADQQLARVQITTAQLALRILFQQEGFRSIDALRRLVRAQAQLPGRKTVLYISEGLVIPPEQPELLRSVVSEANRGNITFYTLDARGLNTFSNNKLSAASNEAINADAFDTTGGTVNATDLQVNARTLAEGTGGFAMDNSNDLRSPLRHLMEDVRAHYEMTYTPTSLNYDGRFRALEVRVSRAGVKVQSRKGYFALPLINGETVAPFEIAALRALNAQPMPQSFEFHTAALRFQAGADGTDYRVVFSIPSRVLRFNEDPHTKSFRVRVSVMGLVKDASDQVVGRISRDVPFQAALDRKAEFEKGEVTVTLPLHLPPGRYHLEAVVLDREASTASVRKTALVVPAVSSSPAATLGVSDFVWVRRVQPSSDVRDYSDPLDSPSGKITPDLQAVHSRAEAASFFFVVYPPAGAGKGDKPVAQIVLSKDGKPIATLQPEAPAPDQGQAYPFSGSIPLANLQPGQYDLAVVASESGAAARAHAQLTVE